MVIDMQFRVRLLFGGFAVFFVLVILRLFYWQIVKGAELSDEARDQYRVNRTTLAPRGSILAQDNTFLATGEESFIVYADLNLFDANPKDTSETLTEIYLRDEKFEVKEDEKPKEDEEETKENNIKTEPVKKLDSEELKKLAYERQEDLILEQLLREDAVWVPLLPKISRNKKQEIEELDLRGLVFEPIETRHYPEGSSSAQLLGFVGKNDNGEDKGYFGLEGFYDLVLSGKPGFSSREENVKGDPNLLGVSKEISGLGGVDLVTHIDKRVQFLIEDKLERAIETYGAVSGSITVADPKTGAILGMASYPSYDPLKYSEFSDELFRNPVVSDSFEPGSIFKVLVMASALDAGVVEPDTKCDICSGPYKIDKYFIRTWNNEYNPNSTMTDVIVHSDNTGMVFAGNKLGVDKLHDYLSSFGLGEATGIDLQGEAVPAFRDKEDWSVVDLATISFGQGIAVTPIQMVRAVSAIANDGVIHTPKVVDRLIAQDWEEDVDIGVGKRVIDKKAAEEITAMMVSAAKDGEAKWTYTRGFKVAGKTGTAQIPIEGHYDDDKTIASYIGFAPADDPEFLMLVTLREPESSPWASETAAPLWYDIARELFVYYGIQPED